MVPTFLLVALALDGLLTGIASKISRRNTLIIGWTLVLGLCSISAYQNFDLVFRQYASQYASGAWNSSEMGAVIKQFGQTFGSTDNAWIVPYPYWVDTRLPGVWAGIPNRDFALWPQDFEGTMNVAGTKLIIVNVDDKADKPLLQSIYPHGVWSRFTSSTKLEGKDFMILLIPPSQ
jgi:hypothetical protein